MRIRHMEGVAQRRWSGKTKIVMHSATGCCNKFYRRKNGSTTYFLKVYNSFSAILGWAQ
jgi:hypothetical protein